MIPDPPAMPTTPRPVPTRRYVMAWALMIGGPVGSWCCRPWMGAGAFDIGQLVVLMVTLEGRLAALPAARGVAAPHSPPIAGVLPLVRDAAAAVPQGPDDTRRVPRCRRSAGSLLNVLTGAALVWVVPRFLPASTPWAVRFWIALTGFTFLMLIARLDFYVFLFRAMGFAVEKVWDCPIASTSLGDFWGRRWNRIVSGMLREVVFFPLSRRAGSKVALLAVFLYSGLYHEIVSVVARSGYGRPTLYFLVQYLGVTIENSRPARRLLRGSPLAGSGLDLRRRGPAGRPVPASRDRRRVSRADPEGGRRPGTGTIAERVTGRAVARPGSGGSRARTLPADGPASFRDDR